MSFKKSTEYKNLSGELRVLEKVNRFLYAVELWLLNDKTNRNNWRYENLESAREKFVGTPILIAYVGSQVGDKHNFEMRTDPKTGKKYASFVGAESERIIGTISDNEKDIELVEKDGANWIKARGTLFAWYAHEAVGKITSQGSGLSVSIETYINEGRMDGDTEVYSDYEILGTTILGDFVQPAVAGAHIKSADEMESEFRELKMKAAAYLEKPKSEPHNKTKGVKETMNKIAKAEMQKRFEGYTVLSVSDDGKRVCLIDKDGTPSRFEFDDSGEIDTARFQRVCATAVFGAEEDSQSTDLEEVTSVFKARLQTAESELEAAKTALATATAKMQAMETRENARRVAAVKAALVNTLAKINETREEPIEESVCDEIVAAADRGEYTGCEDDKGEWCGDTKACAVLKAICMDIITAEAIKANTAAKKDFVWNGTERKAPNADGIDGLLSRMSK